MAVTKAGMSPKPEGIPEPSTGYETATVEQPEDASMRLGLPRRRRKPKPEPPEGTDAED